jgi:glutaredoxin-like protein
MTRLLNDDLVGQIREVFAGMQNPVQIMFFGSETDCTYCVETSQLVGELAELSEQISLSIYDIQKDHDLASMYNVDKAPGLVIAAREGDQITDFGVRLSGIPSGHEFNSLIQDILMVSMRDSGLNPQTRETLKGLETPITLQVFVTPTCPYCPQAVVLAHKMAMESPMIQAEMVEATEFPELSSRHNVSGVPHTVVNDGKGNLVGAVPETNLLAEIQRVLADRR